jgi:hypothetical protein
LGDNVSYPQIVEYNAAVQDPRHTFSDPELKAGRVAETPLGLPLALSGGFALTYTVQSGSKKFAVRCFHREVPQVQNRYAKISSKFRSLASSYFVNFEFQPQGIRVLRQQFPIVKMDWAEGETLGVYLDRAATNSTAVGALRQAFATLAEYLERNGVAHGDIQNENVIVSNGTLRLIDYDGMFVAGLPEGQGSEVGHKHFQHPQRGTQHFGPKMDRFSFIVLDTSLEALQADSSLYRRFREGGQAIIFKANDLADPSSSEVFRILEKMPTSRESVKKLSAICRASFTTIPTLAEFKAGQKIPIPTGPSIETTEKATPLVYIGAFTVVDAKDFNAVLRHVGDKIELVGQIISVKWGVGKRGRGKDRPYCFINFGIWNRESVKITIWSEGISNMNTRPTGAWVGNWISVTGLVEPPYNGSHYGRPYRNVGVTVVSDNEILQISMQEGKFRLGQGPSPVAKSTTQSKTETAKPKNKDIMEQIRKGNGSGAGPSAPITPPLSTKQPTQPMRTGSQSRNQTILQTIKTTTAATTTAPTTTPSPASTTFHRASPPPAPSSSGWLSRVLPWVWAVGGLLLLMMLARGR